MTTGSEFEIDPVDAAAQADVAPRPPKTPPVKRQQGRKVDYSSTAAKRLMDRCIEDARQNQPRLDRDRQDWQNLLMYRGGSGQWMIYDRATNTYVERGDDPESGGLPAWVPRAVTNMLGVKIDGVVSILNQSEPSKSWAASTDDDEDRAAAEVAEDADPVLLEEINYDSLRDEINKQIALTHAAALILYYDNDERHGMQQVDILRCPGCGLETMPMEIEDAGNVCPGTLDAQGEEVGDGCGTPGDAFEPAIDETGTPKGVQYAKGKICATLVPSFEFSLPSSARVCDAKRNPWVLTHSEEPPETVIARWPKAKDLIERKGQRKSGGLQRTYARAMRQLSSPSRAQSGFSSSGQGDGTVVYILQHDPIDDGKDLYFPDGLLAVMIEDTIMEAGPLPVRDDEDIARKSVILRTFSHAPGSAFGKPPADDLVPLQISRNMVDSLIQLILMHDASPRTFIPLTVSLENQPTGRPGETIFYRAMVQGDRPETDRGINPPEGLYKYLEMIDQKFDEVSKLNAVLAGERPEGDPTLGEVQRLEENGMRAFKEPLDSQIRFERDLSLTLLWLAREHAWSDRFRKIRGENGQWEYSQFTAADLGGSIDVVIDKATAWPKSPLMRMLRIQKALEMGVIPPAMQDPELQGKLLDEMDLRWLKPSFDADRKQISRELDRWKAAHSPTEILPPNPSRQELPIHLFFKKQFMKTEEFEALEANNAELAQAMQAHVQQIEMLLQAAMAAQAAAQNPQPAKEDTRTSVEKGDRSTLQGALDSGALQPAGAQPQADPLGDAVNAGALMPAGAMPQAPAGPSIDELTAAGLILPVPQEMPTAPPG